MKEYELVVVLNGTVEDDARLAALEKVKGYITRFGGEIKDAKDWGKKKLAYEIQKMTEAYYYVISFEAPTDAPAQIEARVRIMEQVLRFLITEIPVVKKEKKEA